MAVLDIIKTMKEVIYSKGKVIIDDEYFAVYSKHKWHLTYCRNTDSYRVVRLAVVGDRKKYIHLSREITNCPLGMVVDHINHNTLDNRLCNLRICTPSENRKNLTTRIKSKTGIRGISISGNKYLVQVKNNKKYIYGGRYSNIKNAVDRYVEIAEREFGKFFNKKMYLKEFKNRNSRGFGTRYGGSVTTETVPNSQPSTKEHPMKAYERTKKWREENRDKHQKQWLSYYEKNKELILKRKKIRYQQMKNEDN